MALPTITDVLEYEKGQTPSSAKSGGLFDVLRNSGVGKKISELANYKDPNASAGVMSPLNTKKQRTGRGLGVNLTPEEKRATSGVVSTISSFLGQGGAHVGGVIEALTHGKSFNDYLAELDPLSAVGGRAGKQMGTSEAARRNVIAGSKSTEWDAIPRHLKFRGLDGKMKYEIPDVNSKLNLNNNTKILSAAEDFEIGADGVVNIVRGTYAGKAKDILDHPQLYKAYPHLKDVGIKVEIKPDAAVGGEFNPVFREIKVVAKDIASARAAVIHELGHGVQRKEGATGSNELVAGLIRKGAPVEGIEVRSRNKLPSDVDWANIPDTAVIKMLNEINRINKNTTYTDDLITRYNSILPPKAKKIKTVEELAPVFKDDTTNHDLMVYWNNFSEAETRMAARRLEQFKTVDELMANPVWKNGVADPMHWDTDPALLYFTNLIKTP